MGDGRTGGSGHELIGSLPVEKAPHRMTRVRSALRRWVHSAILRTGFRLVRVKQYQARIHLWELLHDDFFFVQVGAHNGVTSDPFNAMLTAGQWNALLIEPQRPFMDMLETIYADREKVHCCQAAVGEKDGSVKMFMVRSDARDLPYWVSQLASLRYEVIASHEDRVPGLRQWIVETEVPSRKLSTLVTEVRFPRVDLLAIDVEGYDFEVVKQIDDLAFLPKMVYYEHRHLADDQYRQSLKFLKDRGYRTESFDGDTFAERP